MQVSECFQNVFHVDTSQIYPSGNTFSVTTRCVRFGMFGIDLIPTKYLASIADSNPDLSLIHH